MARILSDPNSGKLDELIRHNEYIIGIKGQGLGKRKVKKKFSIKDVKRVIFKRGEEKEALKLFVDINKDILISDVKFRYKICFYPMKLFKYYYKYLIENKLDNDIPLMEEYALKKFIGFDKDKKFCKYMRRRCPKLLENPDSLLHDCDFINKFVDYSEIR